MELQTWQAFFGKLSKFFMDNERSINQDVDRISSVCDDAKYYLSTVSEIVQIMDNEIPSACCSMDDDELSLATEMISILEVLKSQLAEIVVTLVEKAEDLTRSHVSVDTLDFSLEQMCYLRSIGLSWTRISSLFGVSRMTLYLKRKEAGILDDFRYSTISDEELEQKIREIKQQMPDIGERMVGGVLHSNAIFVQRHRIRQAIHSVDPLNTALRWHQKIHRRSYSVPGPMSLWHIG